MYNGVKLYRVIIMLSNNVYYALVNKWSMDKSKAPNALTNLIGSNEINRIVKLSNLVNGSLKSIVSENGEYYFECNEHGALIGYGDKSTGIITENSHLTYERINLDVAIAIVNTLPEISIILSDIQKARASRVPVLPESVINVLSDCFHKIDNNGGYTRIGPSDIEYNGYLIPYAYRIMLSNMVYSVNNGLSINTEYNQATARIVSDGIKRLIIKKHLVKDALPKNATIPIITIINEWVMNTSISLEDKLKNIGVY